MSHGTVKQGLIDGCRWARPGSTRTAGGQAGNSVGRTREHDQHREDREKLARGTELDGNNEKLTVEYQPESDTGDDQPGEFNQELNDCVAEPRRVSRRVLRRASLRLWLRVQVCLRESHAERECCVRVLGNQLSVDNRDCERMRVQMVHTSVALEKSNASASNAVFHTHRTVARDAAKTRQFELWQAVECDVRIKSWKVRESQLGVQT